MTPKARKTLLITLSTLLTVIPIGGHLIARHNAFKFGTTMLGAFATVGHEGFADTAELRKLFDHPQIAPYIRTVDRLSLVNGDHDERIRDLQAGLIYYSEQASVPQPQRFTTPPHLKHFQIDTTDPSDDGLMKAAANLILTYMERFR